MASYIFNFQVQLHSLGISLFALVSLGISLFLSLIYFIFLSYLFILLPDILSR